MYPIRCPECGLINHRDDLAFPHCGQCHEDLVRCASCRHHEGSGCRHSQAYVNFSPDGEAAKRCQEFQSRHEVRGSRLMAMLPAPLWVATLLFVILLGLAAAAMFIDPIGRYFTGNPLRVETTVPGQVTEGEPFRVTIRIANLVDRPSTHIYVEFDKKFLSAVELDEMPYPKPSRIDQSRNRLLLEYDPIAPAGQQTLEFSFIPTRGGITPLIANIYAPSNQLSHKIEVPIMVAKGSSPGLNGGAFQ